MNYFDSIQNQTDIVFLNCLRGFTWLNRLVEAEKIALNRFDSNSIIEKVYQEKLVL